MAEDWLLKQWLAVSSRGRWLLASVSFKRPPEQMNWLLPTAKSSEPIAKTEPIHQFSSRGDHRQRRNHDETPSALAAERISKPLRWRRELQTRLRPSGERKARQVTNGQGPF